MAALRICVNDRFVRQAVTGVQRYASEVRTALQAAPQVQVEDWGVPANPVVARLREISGYPAPAGDAVLLSMCNWSPVLRQRRSVAVIHDVLPLEEPWSYAWTYRAAVRAQLAALRVGTTAVVTVSERSRRSLEAVLGRPVAVVPGGVRVPESTAGTPPVDGPYALFVGAHDPRKNLAFVRGLLPTLHGLGLRLVVTTRSSTTTHAVPELTGMSDLSPTSAVIVRDPADDVLWQLYRHARVLLHPSVAEGFGLPVLEAAAVGTVSVSTPVGAVEEILGDPGLVVEPTVDAWSRAISCALDRGDALQGSLIKRARTYTWERTASGIVEVCRAVAAR